MEPIVSIIIPAYNPGKLLFRALKSVYNQTFTNFEVLVVDDGSDDNTGLLIEALKMDNLYYYCIPHRNANVARNFGISQAKGDYVAMLDADDEWLTHHLDMNLNLIEGNSCDGIFSSVILKTQENQRVFRTRSLARNEKMVDYLLATGIGAHTSTLFMKKVAARDILWDDTLKRHQDYDFVIRFSKKYKWLPNPEITTIYYFGHQKQKSVDFHSCIRFIKQYKKEIAPGIYNEYHSCMLAMARDMKAGQKIISYYVNESVRYPFYLSQDKFLIAKNPRNQFHRLVFKLLFMMKNV